MITQDYIYNSSIQDVINLNKIIKLEDIRYRPTLNRDGGSFQLSLI